MRSLKGHSAAIGVQRRGIVGGDADFPRMLFSYHDIRDEM